MNDYIPKNLNEIKTNLLSIQQYLNSISNENYSNSQSSEDE